MNELYLATEIFRNYGGQRVDQGAGKGEQLVVFDQGNNEPQKVTYDWINDNLGLLTSYRGSIQQYLQEKCPNLVEKDLLKLQDFGIIPFSHSGSLLRKEYSPGKKEVSIGAVKYYIGRDFFIYGKDKVPMQNLKVVVLDDKTAGIVVMHEDREELKYTIDLLKQQEVEEKRAGLEEKFGDGVSSSKVFANTYVNKKEITGRIKKFSATNVINKKPEESDEDFEDRRVNVSNYSYINKISKKFVDECGIGIHNLSWREQVWLTAASYDLGVKNKFDDLLNFAKTYGEDGLKSFLSLEHGLEMGEKILSIGRKLENNPVIANKVFRQYTLMAENAENIADEFIDALPNSDKIDKFNIVNDLLLKAKGFLDNAENSLKEKISRHQFFSALQNTNAELELLKQVVSQFSQKEVADLNLREISGIQKFEEMSAKELLNNKKLFNKVVKIIDQQFPKNDGEIFIQECAEKDMDITLTMVDDEILCFYAKKIRGQDVGYLDWFIANPDAPIKGMGEATIKLEFTRPESKDKYYYTVAKPYVKSFELIMEKFGFIAFAGSTEDGEYKHHYVRCRRVPQDLELKSKNFSSEHEQLLQESLKNLCKTPNRVEILLFDGFAYNVCLVDYQDKSHKDDIKKTDPEGWLMEEIDSQAKKGFVLARFIPDDKKEQTFYAVFEKDLASEKDEERIDSAVYNEDSWEESSDHSTSKKALSI